jgi:hypothetical protein
MQRLCFVVTSLFAMASATAQTQWWVSPTGSNANPGTSASPFQTINHAAAVAAAGDVIRLVAATYGDEQGNVVLGTKTLTLVGAGQGATVIRAHTSLNLTLPAGLLATPTAEAHRCALAIQGSATVRVRDLTLDNGFNLPPNGRGYSLWVGTGADAVLDNVECTNARANPINGIQGPLAVNIRGDAPADLTTVTMRNCLVHEYGKGGVVANFNAHVVLDECRIDGFNHAFLGLAAQNAMQISRGATCDIRRCTITDSWYDPPGTVATGILFFEPGSPIVVEDCNFGNCQVGLYFFGSAASTISGSIRRNRVHTAEFGLYTQNISGLTVSDNSFSVTVAGDDNDAADDAGGNTYSGNHYSSLAVAGPHTLAGTAAASDPLAKPLAKGFGPGIVTNLPSGYAPIDLVVANLDADTDSDFAALSQGPTPALALGLNSGGTFAVTNVPFGVAAGAPVAVVAGEFNGAAGRDLAVLTVSVPPSLVEHKVYVFANNGAGAFSLLHTHSIAGAVSPSGLAAGKLDADTIDDLVVTDAGSAGLLAGNAKALLNNGAGTGFATVALAAAYTVACRDASVGDLNGDTFADIAVAEGDAGSGRVHFFQGNGSGGFVAFGASPIALSANSNRVLATDVEGDGDTDLLVSSSRDAFGFGPGGVDVLRNDAGVFTRSLFVVDRGPTEMVAGDLDADADPDTVRRDVALVNFVGGSITVLGNWSRQGAGTGGIVRAGTLATGIGLADIGGDGFADLVYCDAAAGTVVVLPGVPQARADSYGAGSAGTSALVPNLYPVGIPAVPVIGNATFGLGLRNARGFSIAVIAAALDPAPLLPNSILVANIGATWAVVTNFFGTSAVPLPIPASAALAGMPVYCQAGVFDVNGIDTFLPGFALTNGLKLRLGY